MDNNEFQNQSSQSQNNSAKHLEYEQCAKDLETMRSLLSHDFKAPLRGILSTTNWLLEDYQHKLDEDGQSYLRIIQQKANQFTTMLSTMQEYIQIKERKEAMMYIDTHTLLESIIMTYGSLAGIKIHITQELPTIWGGTTLIERLFKSMVMNAIESIDQQQGEINIECKDNRDCWQFQIADNGCGIASRNFDSIFELFYTLDGYKRENGGGIGLSFAKKIVEIMGGHIWLESELGLGTTFFFTLPKHTLEKSEK